MNTTARHLAKTAVWLFAVALAATASQAEAQSCCTSVVAPASGLTYRVEYNTVYKPVEYTTYKKVCETQYVDEEVTTYETVWETERRERTVKVAKQVPETSTRVETVKSYKPVTETIEKDESYDVTRYEPQTVMREERYLVPVEVVETQNREIVETRKVPIQETVMRERSYFVNKPVTTYRSQTVDRGAYVDEITQNPGRTYERFAWQRAGEYVDSQGIRRYRILPGLALTEMHSGPTYSVNKVYRPNLVEEIIPVTSTVREEVREQVPVNITTYRDEQVTRVEPIQVRKTVNEEKVRQFPVTTYKPVTERVEKKTPVQVTRMVEEVSTREVPVTTYKTVIEERTEPYEVRVAKVVPVKRTVRKPVVVERIVPVSYTVSRPQTVVTRTPIITEQVTYTPAPAVRETIIGRTDRPVEETVREVAKPMVDVRKTVIETEDLDVEPKKGLEMPKDKGLLDDVEKGSPYDKEADETPMKP